MLYSLLGASRTFRAFMAALGGFPRGEMSEPHKVKD